MAYKIPVPDPKLNAEYKVFLTDVIAMLNKRNQSKFDPEVTKTIANIQTVVDYITKHGHTDEVGGLTNINPKGFASEAEYKRFYKVTICIRRLNWGEGPRLARGDWHVYKAFNMWLFRKKFMNVR